MKPNKQDIDNEEMLPEYDFSGAERGKFADAYRRGHKVIIHMADGTTEEHVYPGEDGTVVLEPDVRRFFPDSESVNKALRSLIDLIPKKRKSA
jgi:hypothetical protein